MKNIFKTFLLLVQFGLTSTSCNSASNEKTVNSSDTAKIKQVDTITNNPTVRKLDSGISLFCHLVDSMLSQSKTITSTIEVDTMKAEMTDYRDTRTNLFTSDNVLVKKYTLKNSAISINVVEAIYPDEASANKAFKQTRKESKNPLGLSGGNDFVIKSDKNIYWLMSYRSVRFADHQAMKYLMTKAWGISTIQDSINWSTTDK